MTSPPEEIIVECPNCKRWYEAWHRPSINRLIDNFSDEFIEKASTAICPYCNCKAALGIWLTNSVEQITIRVPQARFRRKSDRPLYALTLDHIDPTCRLSIMEVIRSITNLGLSDVKELLEHLPQILIEDRDQKKLESLKTTLEAAGAQVTIDYSSNQ
ncbi:ribosomal protein L7/L12 [Leptolyngbya sp. PL-A3]|uniref:ribosomal protein L7/L12 n=1 Tax=Leptolyngbya sp. PL-A3 TaxID=2933911 RepID=UPI003299EB96